MLKKKTQVAPITNNKKIYLHISHVKQENIVNKITKINNNNKKIIFFLYTHTLRKKYDNIKMTLLFHFLLKTYLHSLSYFLVLYFCHSGELFGNIDKKMYQSDYYI